MATFKSLNVSTKSASGSALSTSAVRHFQSEVELSPVVSVSAVRGNVRLNGVLTVAGEAISVSAVSAPNEAVITIGGTGTALSTSQVTGNVRLNGELIVGEQKATSQSNASGHWQQTDQVFEPLQVLVAASSGYAQSDTSFETLTSTGDTLLEEIAFADGEISFAPLLGNGFGVSGGIALTPSEGRMEPLGSIASEGAYAQAEGSFFGLLSVGFEKTFPLSGNLQQPASTLLASGVEFRGEAGLVQPRSILSGYFGAAAQLIQPAFDFDVDATINVVGRAKALQPRSTLTASATTGSVGTSSLSQPRSRITAAAGWRLNLVSPGHALAIDATIGGAGRVELSQPRTVLIASGSEDNIGRAELVQPASSFGTTGIVLLEHPIAQLIALGGEQVEQTVFAAYAINLAHSGVTQFTEYPFRRIVQFNGEYFGVGPQGVFRIEGNKDAGEAIRSVIETGCPDFGTSLFKRVTYTYLLMDTADVLHVSPITGDDQTHRRQALGSDRTGTHTRRVQFGKGLKARNWGVKLEHEGDDRFTLQDIEIVGEVLTRKVGG